ncbi:MAG: hypothetical protein ACE5MK_13505 [Acidobacteriota bacterium]
MRKVKVLELPGAIAGAAVLGVILLPNEGLGQKATTTTHTIYMNAVEVKGATTADKLAPPAVDPKNFSKGYGFKAPGEIDKNKPKRWQVASYMFTPSFATVHQGDTVKLIVFIVNGDKHEVWITAPDGQKVVAPKKWNRGREYHVQFVAEKTGTYQLVCSEHAPSMIATFLVLPR